MKWSHELVNELNEVVTYLKKSSMGVMLEYFANYYIKKNLKYLKINIGDYKMIFVDNFSNDSTTQIPNISDGEYKLAFICELINLHCKKKNKRIPKNIYEYFSNMLRYCLGKKFSYSSHKIDYNGYYLISLLKDHFKDFASENAENSELLQSKPFKDYRIIETKSDIFQFSYYLVTRIMKEENDIALLTSLICHSENVDLSILNFVSRRSIYEILKSKRTLYIRFLLVLTFEMLKIPNILDPNWVKSAIYFSDYESFTIVLNSLIIETMIFLTSHKIGKKSSNN